MKNYISFKTRILLSFGLMLFLMIALALYSYLNNKQSEATLVEIDSTILPQALLASEMGKDVVQVQQYLTDVSATHNLGGYEEAEKSAKSFQQGLTTIRLKSANDAEQLKKLAEIELNFDKFYVDGKRMANAYVVNGLDAGNKIMEEFDQSSLDLAKTMGDFRDVQVSAATAHVHEIAASTQKNSKITTVVVLFSILFGLGIVYFLIRYLSQQLGVDPLFAKEIANEIAEGKFSRTIEINPADTSSLLFALKNMQVQLRDRIEQEAKEKAIALRIQLALDKTTANVMMADAEHNIIYINDALRDMFRTAQSDLRKELPNFDAEKLVGSNIDVFHKNPAHQRGMLGTMQTTLKASFTVGGRNMDFIANPVINAEGQREGTVVEWKDRTQELIIENEIKAIVDAVKVGNLSSRLDTSNKSGFLQSLSVGINDLTGVIENVFTDVGTVMQSVAAGDLTKTITNDYEGTFGEVKNSIVAMQNSLDAFVAAQGEMAKQHADGWISAQMAAEKFPGTYGKMAQEINELVNSHIAVKMQVVNVIGEYAKGNFALDMERLPGEKAKITTAVDGVKAALLAVSSEIKQLAEAGVKGDFSRRSDASKFEYMFNDILTNINTLLETCDTGFGDVSRVTQALAKGDLTQTITREYPGTFGDVKASIISMQNSLNAFVAAQGEMAKQHADGWISAQMAAEKFPGTYGKMAQEINELVNSHIAVKMQVVNVIGEYAKGNFALDMERLPGEKAKITTAVDGVKAALLAVSSEIKQLAEAGINGDFSRRSDADNFEYMFKDILNDINGLLETCDIGFNDVSRVVQALSEGDLTQSITRDYPGTFGEVKTSVNGTITKLCDVFTQIKDSANFISNSSQEIASGNNNLSQRAEEQASSLEETASSMEELTATVKNNSDNAQRANQVASNARALAEKGGTVVHSAVAAMQEINESSNKIAEIIGVIDEIAFQTNLLALNASVEAARAGEQGRGFSVVATEVRNLAQRSATAARQSKELIQASVQKVRSGTQFVNETGTALNDIVGGIKQVGDIVAEIASASVQQSSGIEQVNQAVAQMDEITQQNAALAEEASAASVSMSDQSASMTVLLDFFRVSKESGTVQRASKAVKTTGSAPKLHAVKTVAIASAIGVPQYEDDGQWDEF